MEREKVMVLNLRTRVESQAMQTTRRKTQTRKGIMRWLRGNQLPLWQLIGIRSMVSVPHWDTLFLGR